MSKDVSGRVGAWFRSTFRIFAAPGVRLSALALVGVLLIGAVVQDAEARRMGGSRSMGRQSTAVTQQQAAAPTRAPQQAQTPSTTPPSAATPPRNRWMGPIAGLAAGLGIAALLSHFGLGGAFAGAMANMLVIAAIAFVGIWLVRKFMRRRDADTPSFAGASGRTGSHSAFDQTRFNAPPSAGYPAQSPSVGATSDASSAWTSGAAAGAAAGGAATAAASAPWGVPADFDQAAFLHNAKVYFVRMQASWDAGDLDDIRDFTTPEMFAEIRLDLTSRGASENRTDVVRVDAELLGIEDQASDHLASVRFFGQIREDKGAPANDFTEVWNLVKHKQGGAGWLLAGIQQPH